MSWRTIVVTKRAKLEYKMNYLVVREKETKRVFLDDISMIVVESTAVSITAVLISECLKRKIKIVFCDEKRNPAGELVPYYGSYDSSKRVKIQAKWKEENKANIWASIVREKILRQRDILKRFNKDNVDLLDEYVLAVEPGDETNREGHAAKVYFNSLFGNNFSRDDDNAINAALNYGYSILLSLFNRTIVGAGYITQLGIFHKNQFNQFNLSSDLMEPFRPIVDRKVVSLMPTEFTQEIKYSMIDILNESLQIRGKIYNLQTAVLIYTKSVLDALEHGNSNEIRFFDNEL